jgi:hypothetical protein
MTSARAPLSKFRRRLCGWAALLLFLFLPNASAQLAPPGAQLRGSIVDENGLAVPAVEIILRAPDGKLLTIYSDETGRFALDSVVPGEYRASLRKAGFFRLADQALLLVAGENQVSFALSHEYEVHEKVDVRSSANPIEPEQTTHQRTLVARDIRALPVPTSHDLRSALPAVPGVLLDNAGELHVHGARADEVLYLLDGFDIGNPASGRFGARVSVDAVRAVQVEGARLGAEYPYAAAGVLALDTALGDDRWRFGATNFFPGLNVERGVRLGNWFPRFTLSGPLRKGRAWIFSALSLQHTLGVVPELPRGQDITSEWAGDLLLRVQFNVTPAHFLQGSVLVNSRNVAHLGLGPYAPLSTTTDLRARRYFVSFKDQFWFRKALVEFGFAADRTRSDLLPQGSQPYVVTPTGALGNYFETLHQQAERLQLRGSAILTHRQWHGAHDLEFGFNAAWIVFRHAAIRSSSEVLRLDQTLLERATFSAPARFRLSDTQLGLYAQDSWRLSPRLRLRAGVRLDGDRLLGELVPAPHLALNVLPFASGRAKLSIGWGVSHQRPSLVLLGQAYDQQREDLFFDVTGTNPVPPPVVTRFARPAGGLRTPRYYSTSLEWVQKLGPSTFAGLHLLERRQRYGLAYDRDPAALPDNLLLLRNRRRDRYRALELSFYHAFGEKADVAVDYARSRARTNQALDYWLGDVLFAAQAPGPVSWDAPNRLTLRGGAPAPFWHLQISYFLEYRTGFPFSVVNLRRELVGAPNRLRFPDYASLNLAVEKRLTFRGREWAVQGVVVNATGRHNPNAVINNCDAPDFLSFAGGQRRALTGRLRYLGRK